MWRGKFCLHATLITLTIAPNSFKNRNMLAINDDNKKLCRGWVLLGTHAIGLSGILSIFIVFLRMPFLKTLVSDADRLFDVSLVIHVNFSVLVWLCSMFSLLISMTIKEKLKYLNYTWIVSAIGAGLILLSAIGKDAIPIKSNYIPVMDNRTFFMGLGFFFAGVVINALLAVRRTNSLTKSSISVGVYGISAMITAVIVCFITAYSMTSTATDPLTFYESVFWGAGHLLQGVFGQAFVVVLLMYAKDFVFTNRYIVSAVFVINTASVVLASGAHIVYPHDQGALVAFFMWHMRMAEAIIPLFLACVFIANVRRILRVENLHFLCSAGMFIYGSILGIFSIMHETVIIPAHYHGCVVGMTAAFMGFVYSMLPELGYATVRLKLRNIQLLVYTIGQAMHITGLELLGGYGSLRKVTYLPSAVSKAAKYCFTIGGTIAIVGGFLFVLFALTSIYKRSTSEA